MRLGVGRVLAKHRTSRRGSVNYSRTDQGGAMPHHETTHECSHVDRDGLR